MPSSLDFFLRIYSYTDLPLCGEWKSEQFCQKIWIGPKKIWIYRFSSRLCYQPSSCGKCTRLQKAYFHERSKCNPVLQGLKMTHLMLFSVLILFLDNFYSWHIGLSHTWLGKIKNLLNFAGSTCWKRNQIFHGEQIHNLLESVIFYFINNLKSVIHSIVQSLNWEIGQFNFKYKNNAVTLRLVKHDVACN